MPAQSQEQLRRSSSARSGGSTGTQTNANSYVALMRRQKATVWCERSQHEDARLLAAQKAAKARAQAEMARDGRTRTMGGASAVSGGGGVRITAKIRHQKLAAYGGTGGGDWGVGVGGVPMRLSATEVEGGDSDEEEGWYNKGAESKRSSIVSRRYRGSGGQPGRWSRDGTPPSGGTSARNSLGEVREDGRQVQGQGQKSNTMTSQQTETRSTGSGSSGERADAVPDLDAARVASNSLLRSTTGGSGVKRQPSSRNPEDLRRRGSVDERTATMGLGGASMGRLFIANPDADSD